MTSSATSIFYDCMAMNMTSVAFAFFESFPMNLGVNSTFPSPFRRDVFIGFLCPDQCCGHSEPKSRASVIPFQCCHLSV